MSTNYRNLKTLQPNREGLDFEEWVCAADPAAGARMPAYFKLADARSNPLFKRYVGPWLVGEDPTDWRAALSEKEA